MTICQWIVCERTGRWAAALRQLIARQAALTAAAVNVFEVRSLGELTARLEEQPQRTSFVEVHATNLDEVLTWLAEASVLRPAAQHVALLDNELTRGRHTAGRPKTDLLTDVMAALVEAGMAEIVSSPRRLEQVIDLYQRQLRTSSPRYHKISAGGSLSDWAWAALPWQGA